MVRVAQNQITGAEWYENNELDTKRIFRVH